MMHIDHARPPCPNCGELEGAVMGDSSWGHSALCCSEKCGIEYAKSARRAVREVVENRRAREVVDYDSRCAAEALLEAVLGKPLAVVKIIGEMSREKIMPKARMEHYLRVHPNYAPEIIDHSRAMIQASTRRVARPIPGDPPLVVGEREWVAAYFKALDSMMVMEDSK